MAIKAAFIVPHPPIIMKEIGHGEEQKIQNTIDSFHEIARIIANIKPARIVLVSPHGNCYHDYFHIFSKERFKGDLSSFRAKSISVDVKCDKALAELIAAEARTMHIPSGSLGHKDLFFDHGAVIPLYFINQAYTDYELVHISLSGLSLIDHYGLGIAIQKAALRNNKDTVFVASGDLSHRLKEKGPYGFTREGVEFDKEIIKIIDSGDFSKLFDIPSYIVRQAAECGFKSLVMLAGFLDKLDVKSRLLSYQDTFGVGYAVGAFIAKGQNSKRCFVEKYKNFEDKKMKKEDEYVALARYAVEYYVKNKKIPSVPEDLSDELKNKKAGVFVSLKKHGNLRGCIGTIAPLRDSVAEEIIYNAISSCSDDPRFNAVTIEELEDLEYSVDELFPPEKINGKAELDPEKYGVIVSKGYRRGLLLPNLEGVDTVDYQVSIALQKAGIMPHEKYSLERFKVVRHQ